MKELIDRVENLVFKFSAKIESGTWERLPIHLDYEAGKYRQAELKSIIRDALPHFALTPTEFAEYSKNGDFGEAYRDSWNRISSRHKYRKGDYGELLLFLMLKVFYKADKFVTKVRIKTGNQEVLGYDCAHFTIEGDDIILWLGESKFYSNFNNAVDTAVKSLNQHCTVSFTKKEFSFLVPHLEVNRSFSQYDKLLSILKNKESFDKLKIRVPVFITYNSNKIPKHTSIARPEFIKDLKTEFEAKFNLIDGKPLNLNHNFELLLVVLPLQSVRDLKDEIDQLEQANR